MITAPHISIEADRIARDGAPYPYPEPLPVTAQDANAQAVVRASRAYGRCAVFLVAPGVAVVPGPLTFRSWPVLVLFGCGVLALAVAGVVMPRLAATARRHRAVLAAYGLSVTDAGVVRPVLEVPVRGIAGDVRVEAAKALRTRRWVVFAAALLFVWHTVVWIAMNSRPVEPSPSATFPAIGVVLLGGLVLLGVMSTALVRVVDASGRRIRWEHLTGLGGLLFTIAIFGGITAGNAAQASAKAAEPSRSVLATVEWCTGGRSSSCYGVWPVDGEVYGGYLPTDRPRPGSPYISIEVSAEQPGVVVTLEDPWFSRYGVLVIGPVLALLGLAWAWLVRRANGMLRDAVAGHLPGDKR